MPTLRLLTTLLNKSGEIGVRFRLPAKIANQMREHAKI